MIPFLLPLLDGWEYYVVDVDSPIPLNGKLSILDVDTPGFLFYAMMAVDNPNVRIKIDGYGGGGSSITVDFTPKEVYESGFLSWQPRSVFVTRYDSQNNIYVIAYSPIPPMAFNRARVNIYGTGTLLNAYLEMATISDPESFINSIRGVLGGVVRANRLL